MNGPHFLRKPKSEWPTMKVPEPTEAFVAATIVDEEVEKLSPEEEKDIWIYEKVSDVSDWQRKAWLLVRLKLMIRK